jgi:hypothetical protein
MKPGELVKCPVCGGIIELHYGWRTFGGRGKTNCEHCKSHLLLCMGEILIGTFIEDQSKQEEQG